MSYCPLESPFHLLFKISPLHQIPMSNVQCMFMGAIPLHINYAGTSKALRHLLPCNAILWHSLTVWQVTKTQAYFTPAPAYLPVSKRVLSSWGCEACAAVIGTWHAPLPQERDAYHWVTSIHAPESQNNHPSSAWHKILLAIFLILSCADDMRVLIPSFYVNKLRTTWKIWYTNLLSCRKTGFS